MARYVHGTTFDPQTLRLSLVEASEGRLSPSLADSFVYYCFAYDPSVGKYTATAMTVMKIGGAAVVLTLGAVIAFLVVARAERPAPPAPDGGHAGGRGRNGRRRSGPAGRGVRVRKPKHPGHTTMKPSLLILLTLPLLLSAGLAAAAPTPPNVTTDAPKPRRRPTERAGRRRQGRGQDGRPLRRRPRAGGAGAADDRQDADERRDGRRHRGGGRGARGAGRDRHRPGEHPDPAAGRGERGRRRPRPGVGGGRRPRARPPRRSGRPRISSTRAGRRSSAR